MGLDMVAVVVSNNEGSDELTISRNAKVEELWYWRKHSSLHGWMEQLYHEKGGTKVFNCENVRLTLDDLDRLERDIVEYKLPDTDGPFFGNNRPDEQTNKNDLDFIAAARQVLLNSDDQVYYSSWW